MTVDRMLAIAGLILAVVAIPISVFIARRGRRKPLLCYSIDTSVIMSPHGDLLAQGLKIELDGRDLRQVSRTRVALWNAGGSDPIHGKDIVLDDPLRVNFNGGDVALVRRVISCSREQNKLSLRRSEENLGRVGIEFDFLDAADGAVLELVHENPTPPQILGTIRGVDLRKVVATPDSQWVPEDGSRRAYARKGNIARLSMMVAVSICGIFIWIDVSRRRQLLDVLSEREIRSDETARLTLDIVNRVGQTPPALSIAIYAVMGVAGAAALFNTYYLYRSIARRVPESIYRSPSHDSRAV